MAEHLRRWFGLRRQLAAAITAVLALALALTFIAVHRGTESELRGRLDDDLRAQADEIGAELAVGRPVDADSALEIARAHVSSQSFGRTSQVIAVTVPGAGIVTNQPDLLGVDSQTEKESGGEVATEGDQARLIRSSRPGFADVTVADVGQVRLFTRVTTAGPEGPPATIRIGEPLDPVARALDGLSRTFLLVGVATLALGILAGVILAVRIAAPLRRMAGTAEAVDGGDLTHRLDLPVARDELRTLAESFNGMLERLQGAFARERRFVADASHELRTPLTVIRGQLEVLARESDVDRADVERVAGLVTGEVDRMERMVEDLLELARGDAGIVVKAEPIELGEFARDVFASMSFTADRRFDVRRVDAGELVGDPDLISQLLRILTRNAVEHTAEGGHVTLTVRNLGESWEISIEDDGHGIPEQDRSRVFERFYRTDASRSRGTGGTGLGLAIAAAITAAHGGEIEASDSDLGGALLSVRLPRGPATEHS